MIGIVPALTFPTLGAMLAYEDSRPKPLENAVRVRPALMNIEDRRIRWGIPVPELRVAQVPDGHSETRYSLPLVSLRF